MNTSVTTLDDAKPARQGPTAALGSALRGVRSLGPGRILALGAVLLAMAAFFTFVIVRASQAPYTLLFGGLQLADSEKLVQRLEGMGVPYRLSPGGDAIMVPADRALQLRMSLAEEGAPLGNTVGYELFDRASVFGASDFLSNVTLVRALEGELSRTIGTLRHVRSARVHIVQPRREPFSREAVKPTASIVLGLGGASLDRRQVDGIRHLVASAVPGLTVDAVTLVDDSGELLGAAGGMAADGLGETEAYRIGYEQRLKAKIVQLLERTLGPGRADAEVAADMDFDAVSTTSEVYDPNGQVVRSTQTTQDKREQADQQPSEQVSVANNLPTERGSANGGSNAANSNEHSDRTEETTNYEISRKVINQTRHVGEVRRLTIAVQVDGLRKTQPDGSSAYEQRPQAELQQLAALVRTAAGVNEERGDVVEVVSREFVAAPADEPQPAGLLGLSHDDWSRVAELATLAFLTLAVLIFAVRPILRSVLPGAAARAELAAPPVTVVGGDGVPLLANSTGDALGQLERLGQPAASGEILSAEPVPALPPINEAGAPRMLDLANVAGRVRASLIEQVSQIVTERPDDAARVVRAWLQAE